MAFDLFAFHEQIQREGIIFSFSGPISQSVVEGIGETLRQKMRLEEADFKTVQNVFSIFVEQMQNILNYSAERIAEGNQSELRVGVLVIGAYEDMFYVLCGNKVFNCDIARLREKIESVRGLDRDQLKYLYMEKRREATEPESKGAGLGIIDLARKSGRPIEYGFKPIDDTYSFFSIKVMTR